MENSLFRSFLLRVEKRRITAPADFYAAKQIGLRTRHAIKSVRIELCGFAEDIRVRMKANARTTTVVDFADIFKPALRNAARKALAIKAAIARDFDFQNI